MRYRIPEAVRHAPLLLRARRFDVRQVVAPAVGSDPTPMVREVVVHPGAVVVLPLIGPDEDPSVVLIQNRRTVSEQPLWELPAGTLEPDEDPADCAARELVEETGYRADRITPLTRFFTCPGICTEMMYAFLAQGLTHVGQRLEHGEEIVAHPTPLDRVMHMIRTGELHDGKSMAAILHWRTFTPGSSSPPLPAAPNPA